MPGTFTCSVVTPEAKAFDGEVSYVVLPAHDGQIGFAVNRAPILTQIGDGQLTLTLADGSKQELHIRGGFAQMKDNQLTVLTDKADADRLAAAADA